MDMKPSTDYHPPSVQSINQELRSQYAAGAPPVALTEASLIAAARRDTGLDRFGDESFLPGLRVLLQSLETEAHLNPFGRVHAEAEITGSLKNRLWANACFEAHPEILQREIEAPVIIVGPIRSGTTRLQRMLATDSRLQYLKAWEGFNPAPRMGQAEMGKTVRCEEVKTFLNFGQELNPGAFAAHPMEAEWADEEILLLNHSFCGLSPSLMFHVPSYNRWLLDHDKTAVYRYMVNLMKLISWSRGDPESKRWIMKTPQHMLDLDVLIEAFPDAKLIFTHRDPIKTVASTMSLAWNFSVQNTDLPCRASVRDTWMDFSEMMARRSMQARASIPITQQLDVYYDEVNCDWRGVMRRIYDFVGIEFTSQAEHGMDIWLAASESENRHGGHRYSLADYGVTDQEIDARMTFLRDRYKIPYEEK